MLRFSIRRALILSISLHLVLALVLALPHFERPSTAPETVTVEIIPSAPAENPRVRKSARIDKTKQIVEQDEKSVNEEKPDTEAYLSAKNQRVLKETVARERGDFRNARDAKSVEADAKKTAQGTPGRKGPKSKPTLHDLMGTSAEAMLQRHEERDSQQTGDGDAGPKSAEASRTNDYLKNTDSGGETLLNTREFRYYTYYSRIRRQLSQYWEPTVRDKLTRMFKKGRRIASDQDHVTKLLIVLNTEGVLVRVQVLSESGVVDLDEAATEAFRAAAPFPNPPKGIVEDDGTVKIRWDFVLES